MDYLLGILTGWCISYWFYHEALKKYKREVMKINAESEKAGAEMAIQELIKEKL